MAWSERAAEELGVPGEGKGLGGGQAKGGFKNENEKPLQSTNSHTPNPPSKSFNRSNGDRQKTPGTSQPNAGGEAVGCHQAKLRDFFRLAGTTDTTVDPT